MGVSEDGLLLVEELLGEIVQQAGNTVYRHHLQRRVVPYAVQRAKADALSVIEWLYIQHDERTEDTSETAFNDEPSPSPVDSWARGVIESSFVKRPSTPSLSSSFVQVSSSSPNEQSNHSPPPQRPATMPFPSSSKTTPAFQKNIKPKQALPQQPNKPKQSIPVRTHATTTTTNINSNTTNTTNNTTTTTTTTTAISSRSSTGVDSKKQTNKTIANTNVVKDSNKAKQEDESEKFAKFKRDIRNRDYFYDHNGNIVIVNQADYDKFPITNKANMKVSIIATGTETTPSSAPSSNNYNNNNNNYNNTNNNNNNYNNNNGGKSQPASPQRRKKIQEPFKPMPSPPSNKFYKEIKLAQPTMMDTSVKIAPGVTLHPVERRKDNSTPSPPRALLRKKEAQQQQHPPLQQQKSEPILPIIPIPSSSSSHSHQSHHSHSIHPSSSIIPSSATLSLDPSGLYGSTQKMWTTEMLSENFNSLLPSIKPRSPSSGFM